MIDTSQFAFPKPGHAAGRRVESPSQYSRTKRQMWLDQGRECLKCGRPLDTPGDGHRHHLAKRGMGGSKRDDRFTALLCVICHLVEEGQLQPQMKGAA